MTKRPVFSFLYYEGPQRIRSRWDCTMERAGHKMRIRLKNGDILFEGYTRVIDGQIVPHGRRGTMYMYNAQIPGRSYSLSCRWYKGWPIGLCHEAYLINGKIKASYSISSERRIVGHCLTYYASGFLETDAYYDVSGIQIGPYTRYYPNGKKQTEGQLDAQGLRHGEQTAYDLSGHMIEMNNFVHGNLLQ